MMHLVLQWEMIISEMVPFFKGKADILRRLIPLFQ